jgi:hypothetical protein
MGQHDASRLGDSTQTDEEERSPPTDPPPPPPERDLEAAASGWLGRGYIVRYRDPYLLQLMRRERPSWRDALLLAAAAAAAGAAVSLGLRAYRRRLWHVVTLVVRPDGRILTHQIRAPRPPAP